MVEPGSKIKARVTQVEHYGVWLDYQGHKALVLVPEFSWSPVQLQEAVRPGELLDLQVLRYDYQGRVIVGSIRRLHPDQNPFRRLSRLEPDTLLRGRVTGTSAGDLRVELVDFPNAWGLAKRAAKSGINVGDEVLITIAALEPDDGHLTLTLVRHHDRSEAELVAQESS